MSRSLALLSIVVAFGIGVAVGVFGLLWATGGNAEPSRDAAEVAPTLSLEQAEPTSNVIEQMATEIAAVNSKVDALSAQVNNLDIQVAEAMATPTPEPSPTPMPTPERALFRIDPEQSEARFRITEELLGQPKEVVGATKRVAGDVIVNYSNPAESQIGTIAINARTFMTDNEFRDQSIRGQILESSQDEYEFITFEPTGIQELSGSVSVGQTAEFQIVGNLTIHGTTRELVFDARVTADAVDQITGFVTTEVLYSDFGLTIKPPPNVANISDNVILEMDFVATVVSE